MEKSATRLQILPCRKLKSGLEFSLRTYGGVGLAVLIVDVILLQNGCDFEKSGQAFVFALMSAVHQVFSALWRMAAVVRNFFCAYGCAIAGCKKKARLC